MGTDTQVNYNRVNTYGLWLWLWISVVVLGDSLFYWHNRPWYIFVEVYPYITAVFAGSLLAPFVTTVNPKWSFWLFSFFMAISGFVHSPVAFVVFVIGFIFYAYRDGLWLHLPVVVPLGVLYLWLFGYTPVSFIAVALMLVFSLYYHPILVEDRFYRDTRLMFLIVWVLTSLIAMIYKGLTITAQDVLLVVQGVTAATGWFFLDRYFTRRRPTTVSLYVAFVWVIVFMFLLHDSPRYVPVDHLFESGWFLYDK